MIGTSATTGKHLSGLEHLRQSVRDILTTPVGTRAMRRDYGSRLYALVDSPLNEGGLLDLFVATAEALATWEPRIEVERVEAVRDGAGGVEISVSGRYLPDGRQITIDGIEVS